MAKQQAHTQGAPVPRLGWRLAFSWLACLASYLAAWFVLDRLARQPLPGGWLLLLLVLVLLALVTERLLALTPLRRDWALRLALLAPAAALALHWLVSRLEPASAYSAFSLLAGWVGAFLGVLLAGGLSDSFWENNSPPSEAVSRQVHQRHLEAIGLPARTPAGKRLFDVVLAAFGLLVSLPVWLVGGLLVWLEDPGPLLFVKNSVGRGGANFRQYKFRSMLHGAEESTGPVLASEQDERVLLAGRFLRKTALDELPQLVNILRGEMSFVGPRPQRTVLVHQYLETIPGYAERHRVVPGLAGLAQVAGDYYLTPRQKLRLDRLYIRYQGLAFDVKLLTLAFLIAFWFRWQPGWNGRLPRRLLRLGSPPDMPR